MESQTNCDHCGEKINTAEDPLMLEGNTLCEECYNSICSSCFRMIPESEKSYSLGGLFPGVACGRCAGHFIDQLCKGCGTEIYDSEEQIRTHGSTFCEDCADELDGEVVETPNRRDREEDAPF